MQQYQYPEMNHSKFWQNQAKEGQLKIKEFWQNQAKKGQLKTLMKKDNDNQSCNFKEEKKNSENLD